MICLSRFVPPLMHWKRTLLRYWQLPDHLKLHTYSLHIALISAFFFLSIPVIPFGLPTSPNNLIISNILPRCHICVYAIHLFLHYKYCTTASWRNLVSHARDCEYVSVYKHFKLRYFSLFLLHFPVQ